MTKTLEDFIAEEIRTEAARHEHWKQEVTRNREVCMSGMGPGPFVPAAEADILAEAQRKFDRHSVFTASPQSRFLAALGEVQNNAERARSAYCRGLGSLSEQKCAADALTASAEALNAAVKALAEIAGVEA